MLHVRPTVPGDIPLLTSFYEKGIAHMRAEGNTVQWQGMDTPAKKIPADIEKGISYAVVDDENIVHGTFAFIMGKDPTYETIEDGAWPDDEPYGTIHRIVSDQETHGILKAAVEFCRTKTDRLRLDTHKDNKTMQAAVAKLGFRYAGIIHVGDGTPRLAFTKQF